MAQNDNRAVIQLNDCEGEGNECYVHGDACLMGLSDTPQMERPAHLRYLRTGIHDHHLNAARNDAESEHAREHPHDHYDDERCWWNGGADD